MSRNPLTGFEWRAPLGAWRWLILAALGASSSGCSSKAPWDGRDEPTPSACTGETALEGGLQLCDNDLMHRASAGACSELPPAAEAISSDYFGADEAGTPFLCRRNADCTAGPYGRCTPGLDGPYCSYDCVTDADCGDGQLCRCDDFAGGGKCTAASCRTDSDCGDGNLCALDTACSYARFMCQTSSDECAVDGDCSAGQQCLLVQVNGVNPLASPAGFYRACRVEICAIPGRPFLVDGVARSAARVERSDWCSNVDTRRAAPDELAPDLRAEIARGWLEQALMEHASVAAFGRFALQLLSLGAPPDLVADAARAMQDEIRHARDCFRLARRHAPSDIGPGPLPLDGALAEADLVSIVIGTVREGCVGETLAALEAAEALEHCEDEAARPVLERIAAEETRHAQLAWRFVAWALQTRSGAAALELRRSVRAAFAAELGATGGESAVGAFDRELASHGLLGASVRRALRERALREVVAPCAEALLGSHRCGAREPSPTHPAETVSRTRAAGTVTV